VARFSLDRWEIQELFFVLRRLALGFVQAKQFVTYPYNGRRIACKDELGCGWID
jgi:hypothetical protein